MENEFTMRDHLGNVVSLPEETRQQVIGYIKHQGAKGTDDLLALLDRAQRLFEEALTGLDEAQSRFNPSPNDWSIQEILRHADASLRGAALTIKAVSEGRSFGQIDDRPPLSEGDGKPLDEIKRDVSGAFESLRDAVRSLSGGDLSATARHPFFADLNWKEWAVFSYVHMRGHVDQIDQVKTAPGYPA